jgi:4-methyl-5(b-hydroxyethyl)-thiazole monophosphate biosynthesis
MSRVLVPLAQGCEELEAVTIIDLLRRAQIEVVTANLDEKPVRASRGVVLIADSHLDAVLNDDFDMIVLPGGGAGTENLNNDPRIHQLLKKLHAAGKYTAAICAAPKVLATAGLLENKQATSYPTVLTEMQLPTLRFIDAPIVRDDKVITSRGPGTAMDFSLSLIEILVGKAMRDKVEAELVR